MKKVVLSLLAVTAFGATLVGTQTAEAEGWVGSGWYDVGSVATIGNGTTDWERFIVTFGVGAPNAIDGATRAVNMTPFIFVPGATNPVCFPNPKHIPPGAQCPTSFAAATLCQNNDMIIGNWVVTGDGPGLDFSDTSNATGTNAAYYLASGQQWVDTGYCPVFQPQIKGGIFLYQF